MRKEIQEIGEKMNSEKLKVENKVRNTRWL